MPWLYIALALPAGALLGVFFFGGLWLTVNRLSTAVNPTLLFAVSFVLRVAVVLAGFYLLLMQGPFVLLAGLAGFLAARILVISRFRPQQRDRKDSTPDIEQEGGGKA